METILFAAMLAAADDAKPAISMTVYNDGFAMIREPAPLNLKAGVNDVRIAGVASQIEPESVMLRDPADKASWRILEQSYRADSASKQRLLELNEGKTIEFEDRTEQQVRRIRGKIIRAGRGAGNPDQAIVEVDGTLRFGLPGNPLFPPFTDDSILQPSIEWKLQTDQPVQTTAELSYMTHGLSWLAVYNAIITDKDDSSANLSGLVTITNNSGKSFSNVGIRLVAGSVRKVETPRPMPRMLGRAAPMAAMAAAPAPEVTEQSFDDFHMYTLPRPVSLRDDGAKQLDFINATIKSLKSVYVLDEQRFTSGGTRFAPVVGPDETLKVAVHREFDNSVANGLGQPLPRGRIRFLRRDTDGKLEFVGEAEFNHTPIDRPVRVLTGHAFDLFAKRTLVDQRVRNNRVDQQTIEVTVGNRKREPVAVRIIEHFNMGTDWTILEKSQDFTKIDAQSVRFDVTVPAGGETTVKYQVEYRW